MLESVGVPVELQNHALVAIDKLDKIGRDGVAAELSSRGIGGEAIGRLLDAYTPPAGEGGLDARDGQRESPLARPRACRRPCGR